MLAFTGYYHVKNIGDEAFIAVLKQYFPDAIFTDGKFTGNETDVVVGGGEYDNWMIQNAPPNANLYGLGLGLVRDAVGTERAEYLKKFKYLSVRDYVSNDLAFCWRIPCRLGADLAFLLEPKTCSELKNKIVVVPKQGVDPWPLLWGLDHSKIVFVPFHPYDLQTDLRNYPVCVIEDPRIMLGAIAEASLVCCWNKLHPKIFAQNMGVCWSDFSPDVKTLAFQSMCNLYSIRELRTLAKTTINDLKEIL